MSTIRDIMSAFKDQMVSAVPRLDSRKAEIGLRQMVDEVDSNFPALLVHSPSEDTTVLSFRQEQKDLEFTADYWTNDGDLDELLADFDLVVADVRATEAKRTLGSRVRNTFLSLEVFEHPDKGIKFARITVGTTRIE